MHVLQMPSRFDCRDSTSLYASFLWSGASIHDGLIGDFLLPTGQRRILSSRQRLSEGESFNGIQNTAHLFCDRPELCLGNHDSMDSN